MTTDRTPMKWRQESKYYIVSDQNYTVSKSYNQGDVLYSAWRPKEQEGDYRKALGIFRNSIDARQKCQDHYDGIDT